jgi:hypothetical protein
MLDARVMYKMWQLTARSRHLFEVVHILFGTGRVDQVLCHSCKCQRRAQMWQRPVELAKQTSATHSCLKLPDAAPALQAHTKFAFIAQELGGRGRVRRVLHAAAWPTSSNPVDQLQVLQLRLEGCHAATSLRAQIGALPRLLDLGRKHAYSCC